MLPTGGQRADRDDAGDTGLRRDIGFVGSAFLSFNGIVGAAIFALPATLHLQFGTFSPWLFPLFAVLILAVVLPFARLAALHPSSGGPAAYTAVFGPVAAFQVGWLYYLTRVTALAANANVFAVYAAALCPPLGGAAGRIGTILALVAVLTLINIVGVRRAIRALDALTLLKALPLIGLAILGLVWSAGDWPAPGPLPSLSAIEAAALIVFYAFVGFENSVVPAGETRDPGRNIPRALILTVLGTATIYFVIQLAYVSVMPASAAPDAPLAAFAEVLIGPLGAIILSLAALASIAGNITGSLTSTPRVTYALAGQGSLPRWFGAISPRFATPANSILFMGLAGGALAASGSFVWLAIVSTLARLIVYAACIATLPRAERMKPLGYALLAAGLAICLWAAMQSTWLAWGRLAALVAVGVLLYFLARRQAASRAAATVSSIQPPPSTRSPS